MLSLANAGQAGLIIESVANKDLVQGICFSYLQDPNWTIRQAAPRDAYMKEFVLLTTKF